jgi:fibronectin-binding autotransporter adhesin
MIKHHARTIAANRAPLFVILVAVCVALITPSNARAAITWSSGTNTVGADQTLQDTQIVITGGTNTVLGLSGPPAGSTSGGTLRLIGGGVGLQITGSTITLNSDATSAGRLFLQGNVSTSASSTTALIATGGAATNPGKVDLGSGTRIFTVAPGTVASPGPDLSITASVANGGLEKAGTGIIALSGNNTYAGGTMLDAGTFLINSATAIGTSFFTVAGPNTTIDNTTGLAITLTNNNQFNLSGGDLNFAGSNNLNLGTGIFVMSNASRTITVSNPTATLTVGGRIQDSGQDLGLIKSGPGTLVLGGNNLYAGLTTLSAGTLVLNGSTSFGVTTAATTVFVNNGSVSGDVSVSGSMSGAGAIHGSLLIDNGGTANLSSGTVEIDGGIVNDGTFILSHGAQITGETGFTNNGVLDVMTAGPFNPPNFTNNGTVVDSTTVKVKAITRSGNTTTVEVDCYAGHSYQLQKSTTTPDASAFTTNVGDPQGGKTGSVLTFMDSSTGTTFYRVAVDS